ncbi:hypothetical protein [Salinarimonas soli]|uniref:Lipoprotein n=1 Tax=Salinarimonas soli TaxID=1638099 RepID=A0A5B2VBB4_9HYPH|nr:hypothetical protein [Salinarimonas soli]KAA2235619.1 hypothetical protein F0L46_19155 [Salinarimonas soli]
MRVSLLVLGAAVMLQGCVSPTYGPRTASMQPVSLDCGSAFLVNVDGTAKDVLVVPYPASEARYAACTQGAGAPLADRAVIAAVRHLRTGLKQACAPTTVTPAGTGAFLVGYTGCRPLTPGELP